MYNWICTQLGNFLRPEWFYRLWLLAMALVLALTLVSKENGPWLLWGVIVLFLYVCRPGSEMHNLTVEEKTVSKSICTVAAAILLIAACVLPMAVFPLWNGEIPGHRNQYELMAENLLEGRLHFDYGDEDQIAQLENPYDPDERTESGVKYHWDHAYYNGRYYMYFGIVPVLLVFLPYRVITGEALTTYHATQLFVAAAIVGIFLLFHMLAKRFFKKLPFSVYLSLSVSFSLMSVWFSIAQPALYCTAITAAIALEVWSLYFFIKAVWIKREENSQILHAAVGALLGALAFGCRPPIALANLLVIPMLIVFLKQRKFSAALLGKLVLAALPYVIVAAALMTYNYVRFQDPLEFGQAYQLTIADQSQYGFTVDMETMVRIFNNTIRNFFGFSNLTATFPYLQHGGVFFNFPILFLLLCTQQASVRKGLQKATLMPLMTGLTVTVLVITVMDIMWSPTLLERYRMDIYFLFGIACFLSIGFRFNSVSLQKQKSFSAMIVLFAAITCVSCILFTFRSIASYYPDAVSEVGELLLFWKASG